MQSITEQFKAFVASKPADKAYNYWSTADGQCGCALTQFLDNLGHKVGSDLWYKLHGRHGVALHSKPHTFGALADRLSSIDAKVSAE